MTEDVIQIERLVLCDCGRDGCDHCDPPVRSTIEFRSLTDLVEEVHELLDRTARTAHNITGEQRAAVDRILRTMGNESDNV